MPENLRMQDRDIQSRDRSLPELVTGLLGQVSTLLRQEVQLARAEMGEKAGRAVGAITPLAAGAALLFGSLIVLLFAAVSALIRYAEVAPGWSQLIVSAAAALLGFVLIRGALSQLSKSNLVPNASVEQLSRDAQMVKEQVQ